MPPMMGSERPEPADPAVPPPSTDETSQQAPGPGSSEAGGSQHNVRYYRYSAGQQRYVQASRQSHAHHRTPRPADQPTRSDSQDGTKDFDLGEEILRSSKRPRLDPPPPRQPPMKYGWYGQVDHADLKLEVISCDTRLLLAGDAPRSAHSVLRQDGSVYSSPNPEASLLLRHADGMPFCLEHLCIAAPDAGPTSPAREGTAYVAMDVSDLDLLFMLSDRQHPSALDAPAPTLPSPRRSHRRRFSQERLSFTDALRDPEINAAFDRRDPSQDRRAVGRPGSASLERIGASETRSTPADPDAPCEYPAPQQSGDSRRIQADTQHPRPSHPLGIYDPMMRTNNASPQRTSQRRHVPQEATAHRSGAPHVDLAPDHAAALGSEARPVSRTRSPSIDLEPDTPIPLPPDIVEATISAPEAEYSPSQSGFTGNGGHYQAINGPHAPVLNVPIPKPPNLSASTVDPTRNADTKKPQKKRPRYRDVLTVHFKLRPSTNDVTLDFFPAISGRFILLVLSSQSNSVDVQNVVAKGYGGCRYFPAQEMR